MARTRVPMKVGRTGYQAIAGIECHAVSDKPEHTDGSSWRFWHQIHGGSGSAETIETG
jgi:hypothetical protein